MATTVYSDLVVYNEQFQGGFIETLQQNVNAFNAAANGAIRLSTKELMGHYEREAFWDQIATVTRRDISADSTAIAATKLTQDEFIGVKVNRRNGPYETNVDAFRKIARDPGEFSFVLGQQTAVAMPQDMLNRTLAALEGKLDATAALEHDATDGTIATTDLAYGLAKMGDAASRVRLIVMHSKAFFDLVIQQLGSTASVFASDAFGGQVYAGSPVTLGKPVLVTDSASLVETNGVNSSTDAYSTLLLTEGAATIDISEQPTAVLEGPLTGAENLFMRWQSEYAFNLKLKGCAWNTGTGINPTDVAIATGSNWTTKVADNKLLPGAIIKSR